MRRRGHDEALAVGAERDADESRVGGEDDREHDVDEQPSRLRKPRNDHRAEQCGRDDPGVLQCDPQRRGGRLLDAGEVEAQGCAGPRRRRPRAAPRRQHRRSERRDGRAGERAGGDAVARRRAARRAGHRRLRRIACDAGERPAEAVRRVGEVAARDGVGVAARARAARSAGRRAGAVLARSRSGAGPTASATRTSRASPGRRQRVAGESSRACATASRLAVTVQRMCVAASRTGRAVTQLVPQSTTTRPCAAWASRRAR